MVSLLLVYSVRRRQTMRTTRFFPGTFCSIRSNKWCHFISLNCSKTGLYYYFMTTSAIGYTIEDRFRIAQHVDPYSVLSAATRAIVLHSYITQTSTVHITTSAQTTVAYSKQMDFIRMFLTGMNETISYTNQDVSELTSINCTFLRTHNLFIVDEYASVR